MQYIYPLIGVIGFGVGLEYTGPPLNHGNWNPVSIFLWIGLAGFCGRLILAVCGLDPSDTEDRQNGHS